MFLTLYKYNGENKRVESSNMDDAIQVLEWLVRLKVEGSTYDLESNTPDLIIGRSEWHKGEIRVRMGE